MTAMPLSTAEDPRAQAQAEIRAVREDLQVVFQDPLAGSCGPLSIEENLALAYTRGLGRGLSPALGGKRLKAVMSACVNCEADGDACFDAKKNPALRKAIATDRIQRVASTRSCRWLASFSISYWERGTDISG